MKLIYVYGKEGRLRFVSHLDLQRFLIRALNRTCLPIAFSQGFNPHPLLSIASALAMGYESDYEVFEVRVNGSISREKALATMRAALPEQMPVKQVFFAQDSHPSMMSLVKMSDFTIRPEIGFDKIDEAARAFWELEEVKGIRKTKSGEKEVNVRALCKGLETGDGYLKARLMFTETETLKPDLLMDTLCKMAGIETPAFRVRRNALLGIDPKGEARLITEL